MADTADWVRTDRTEQRQKFLKWGGLRPGAGPEWRVWGGNICVPDCCVERHGSMKEGHLLVTGPLALETRLECTTCMPQEPPSTDSWVAENSLLTCARAELSDSS